LRIGRFARPEQADEPAALEQRLALEAMTELGATSVRPATLRIVCDDQGNPVGARHVLDTSRSRRDGATRPAVGVETQILVEEHRDVSLPHGVHRHER
jgi:hypothetical protein